MTRYGYSCLNRSFGPLDGGEYVKAAEVEAVMIPFLELGLQRYAEMFSYAGLGSARDSIFIQDAERLLADLKKR